LARNTHDEHARPRSAPSDAPARVSFAVRFGVPLVIVAIVLAAFWPALQAKFVNWDDEAMIVDNYAFRGLSPSQLEWMFTTTWMGPYQPLSWVTLAIDYLVWGLDPFGFHLTNLALHASTAVALFFLARLLLRIARPASASAQPLDLTWAAFFAAMLFAVHPLRCESVVWIAERRDVLSGFFYVATVTAYLRAARAEPTARVRWLVLSFVLFTLALLSKATGMTLPVVMLLLDAWPLGRLSHSRGERRRALLEKLPFFVIAIVFAYIAILGQASEPNTLREVSKHGIVARVAQAAYALCFYPWKTLVPTTLLPMYQMPHPLDPSEARFVVSALVAVIVTLVVILRRNSRPPAAVAWLAYGVLLAPVSGLVQAGAQLVADRYSYLPCIPFALFAAGGLLFWIQHRPAHRIYAMQLAGGAVLILGILTFQQARIWHNGESLWSYTLKHVPDSHGALLNFGTARLQAGARERDPTQRRRIFEECRLLFESGMKDAPDSACALDLGLTCVLLAEEEPSRSAELLERARACVQGAIERSDARGEASLDLRVHLANILMKLGRNDEALPMLIEFVRATPDHVLGRRLLSVALTNAGRPREAVEHLEHAVRLEPDDVTLWIRLGLTHERIGDLTRARSTLQQGIELRTRSSGERAAEDPDLRQAEQELRRIDPSSSARARD
jgi:tetratricopeptide (TPR) repeat protein